MYQVFRRESWAAKIDYLVVFSTYFYYTYVCRTRFFNIAPRFLECRILLIDEWITKRKCNICARSQTAVAIGPREFPTTKINNNDNNNNDNFICSATQYAGHLVIYTTFIIRAKRVCVLTTWLNSCIKSSVLLYSAVRHGRFASGVMVARIQRSSRFIYPVMYTHRCNITYLSLVRLEEQSKKKKPTDSKNFSRATLSYWYIKYERVSGSLICDPEVVTLFFILMNLIVNSSSFCYLELKTLYFAARNTVII